MQAVINATDEGTRLRPLNCNKNAFALPLLGESAIRRIIKTGKRHGIDEFIIILGYMGESVRADLGNWNEEVKITYIKGGNSDGDLKLCKDVLEDEFFYFSHPVCTMMNFTKMYDYHRRKGAFATCVTKRGIMEGIVSGKGGVVTRIGEPGLWHRISKPDKGAGIYLFKKDIMRFIPEEANVSIGETVLPSLIRSGKSVYTYNEELTENISDIASYVRANMMCLDRISEGIKIEEGAIVEKGALIEKPCYIGEKAHIHKGAKVGSGSVIGEGSIILGGADIKRSIIGKNCRVGKDVSMRGCVTDENVRIDENASVYEKALLGFGCVVGKNSTVKSFVKIWPEKETGEGVTVSENIMWGQKKRVKMFEKGEIKGVVNVDITPSFATKIGECLGFIATMGEIGISTDGSASGQMLKEGIASGLMGQGVLVKDFGEQPFPITRRAVMFYMLDYGIFINTYENNGEEWAEICILKKGGVDIDEESAMRLDALYSEGGFIHPEATSIRESEYHLEYKLHYLKELMKNTAKGKRGMKILLSSPARWGRRLVMSALSDMKVQVSMYPWSGNENDIINHFEASVEDGGFDIGFITDSKCEKLRVVLPMWGEIDECVYDVMHNLIVMMKYKNARLFVPKDASSSVEEMAKKYGAEVIRTKSDKNEIMKHLGGNEDYLTEQFIYRYDAIGAIIKLVEFSIIKEMSLNTLLDKIPRISMARRKIDMNKSEMESVMKNILSAEGERVDEGVKITFDKGWVMVIPDSYKEVCHIVSEGANMETAGELCDIYVEKMVKKE